MQIPIKFRHQKTSDCITNGCRTFSSLNKDECDEETRSSEKNQQKKGQEKDKAARNTKDFVSARRGQYFY